MQRFLDGRSDVFFGWAVLHKKWTEYLFKKSNDWDLGLGHCSDLPAGRLVAVWAATWATGSDKTPLAASLLSSCIPAGPWSCATTSAHALPIAMAYFKLNHPTVLTMYRKTVLCDRFCIYRNSFYRLLTSILSACNLVSSAAGTTRSLWQGRFFTQDVKWHI